MRVRSMQGEDGSGLEPWAHKSGSGQPPLEAGRGKEQIPPWGLQEEPDADTLIIAS